MLFAAEAYVLNAIYASPVSEVKSDVRSES